MKNLVGSQKMSFQPKQSIEILSLFAAHPGKSELHMSWRGKWNTLTLMSEVGKLSQ